MKLHMIWGLFAVALLCLTGSRATAVESPNTTITVSDLHCAGCAKKVATALSKVTGVAKVESDVEAKTLKVIPKEKTMLSPKTLWEAVEKAEKTPSKLEGPSGSFTSKPSN
jgi:Cu+-exporting ATPase